MKNADEEPHDARLHERAPAVIRISYESAGNLMNEYTENISKGGMFIATDDAFEVDQTVDLELQCPGTRRPIPLRGVVRWAGERSPNESSPPIRGVGVEFDLQDPIRRARLEAMIDAAFEPIGEAPAGPPTHVLVVDANPFTRSLFKAGLESMARAGYEAETPLIVTEASGALTALAELRRGGYDLAVVDLATADLDGLGLIRRIRTEISDTLPIFATARPFPGDKAEAVAAGADVFVHKPLQLRPLFNSVKMLLKDGRGETG